MWIAINKSQYWITERFPVSPFYAAILTVLVTFVGILGGGIFPAEVKRSIINIGSLYIGGGFPYLHFPVVLAPLPAGIYWFWGLLWLTGLLYFGREWAVGVSEKKKLQALESIIRTTPPPDILNAFGSTTAKTYRSIISIVAGNETDADKVRVAIRRILGLVANLARRYDRRMVEAEYGANVMVFLPTARIADQNAAAAILKFEPQKDFGVWRGVLLLRPELSATSQADSADQTLVEFALAVPETYEFQDGGRTKYTALPGAPLAFRLSEADHFTDTTRLDEWFDHTGAFSAPQRKLVIDYFFSVRKSVRSFIAIPIFDSGRSAIGVLNIHCNQVDIVNESGVASRRFEKLIEPIVIMLGDHIAHLQKLDPIQL